MKKKYQIQCRRQREEHFGRIHLEIPLSNSVLTGWHSTSNSSIRILYNLLYFRSIIQANLPPFFQGQLFILDYEDRVNRWLALFSIAKIVMPAVILCLDNGVLLGPEILSYGLTPRVERMTLSLVAGHFHSLYSFKPAALLFSCHVTIPTKPTLTHQLCIGVTPTLFTSSSLEDSSLERQHHTSSSPYRRTGCIKLPDKCPPL